MKHRVLRLAAVGVAAVLTTFGVAVGNAVAKDKMVIAVPTFLTGGGAPAFGIPARNGTELIIQAINKGQVYRYVTKPWNDGEMKMVVRAAAHRFDLQESNRQLTAELNKVNAQLDTLDSKLEQRVEERTRELRSAYEENLRLTEALELKVKELERSDRIQSDYNR